MGLSSFYLFSKDFIKSFLPAFVKPESLGIEYDSFSPGCRYLSNVPLVRNSFKLFNSLKLFNY